jgi:uncharacterized protein HemY
LAGINTCHLSPSFISFSASVRGESGAAKASLQKAVALDPSHFEAHLALGRILVGEGHFGEARTHLNAAMKSSDREVKAAVMAALEQLPQ